MISNQEDNIISEFLESIGPFPRKIPEITKKNIQSYLREAGFSHVFKDLDNPATEAYVKDIAGAEIEIEFLTDDSVRNNKDKHVLIAGVVALQLSYLTLALILNDVNLSTKLFH